MDERDGIFNACCYRDQCHADRQEITQLRGNLSLAEEGLANYELEVQRLRQYEPLKGGVPVREFLLQQENELLKQRCWALGVLLYPLGDGPREAVAGDFGLHHSGEPK